MTVPSEIFGLWSEQQRFSRRVVIVDCPAHTNFKRAGLAVWKCIKNSDDQSANSLLDTLYRLIMEVERTPVKFDEGLGAKIAALGGGAHRIQKRWGDDASAAFEELLANVETLCTIGSALRSTIRSMMPTQDRVAVYCHRSDVHSLEGITSDTATFVLTPAQYRVAEVVDVMIKVGGLRHEGIGRIPQSVLTAPRHRQILQFIWSTDKDHDHFGDGAAFLGFRVADHWQVEVHHVYCGHEACIRQAVTLSPETDEMTDWEIAQRPQGGDIPSPVILKLPGNKGIALRRGSHEIVYVASEQRASMKRADDILEGDLLLRYEGSIDFGPKAALENALVDRWRGQLLQELAHDRLGFFQRLRSNGVRLLTLEYAVSAWCHDRRPQAKQTLIQVCLTLGWTEKDAKRLWKVFSSHHSQAVADGGVENMLEREAIVDEINRSTHALIGESSIMGAEPGERLSLDIRVGQECLQVMAFLVDEKQAWEVVKSTKLDKIMDWRELLT